MANSRIKNTKFNSSILKQSTISFITIVKFIITKKDFNIFSSITLMASPYFFYAITIYTFI